MTNVCKYCVIASGWNSAVLFSQQGELTPMKPSIIAKLEALNERHEEVQALLGEAQIIADQDKFRALSREYAQLDSVAGCYNAWRSVQADIAAAQTMLDDAELREMAQEELAVAKNKNDQLEQQLQVLLLPQGRTMDAMPLLKCVPVLAVMKRHCLPGICSGCTAVTQNPGAGR